MPHLSVPRVRRRDFLRAAAGGAVAILSRGSARAADEPAVWALFSDTHVAEDAANEYRGFRPAENLRRVAEEVAGAPVEGAIITGDLARLEGRPGDYRALSRLLAPVRAKMPVAMALGNHDDRANFLSEFAKHPGASGMVKGRHVLVVETPAARLVVLDSLLFVNKVPGLLGKAQRTWLEEYLRSSSGAAPVVILVHHTLDDNDGSLLDADRLLTMLKPIQAVKAVVYGHSHRHNLAEQDGLHLINLPATGYNFADDQPVGWVEAKFTRQGAALTLHAVGGNREASGKTVSLRWR